MSRARQNPTGRLRLAPAVLGIALVLTGCSAGQITQTDTMRPAVNGGAGQLGTIGARDVRLAYPNGGVYHKGENAPLLGAIINGGQKDDELLSVSSPVATKVTITGDRSLPAGRSLLIEAPSGTSTSSSATVTSSPTAPAPSSPTAPSSPPASSSGTPTSGSATTTAPPTTTATKPVTIGKINIVLEGLTEDIASGKTIQVTFTFRSGQMTFVVPVATPDIARTPKAQAEGGH